MERTLSNFPFLAWIIGIGLISGLLGTAPLPATAEDGPTHHTHSEPVAAEEEKGETSPVEPALSLEQLEQMALEGNPTLAQAAAQVQAAAGRTLQAGLYPNPAIGYSGAEISGPASGGEHGGFVQQTIVTAGKLGLSRSVFAQEQVQAEEQAKAQRLRVLNTVRLLYYQTLGAQHLVSWRKMTLVIAMSAGRPFCAPCRRDDTAQAGQWSTVVLVEDHWHPIVALEVCYRIGSRSDPYGKQGLAHLLEHLTFPSPAFRHEGDAKPAALLGRAGATTNHDTTCYSHRLLSAEIERALAVEAERMATLRVGPEDLAREKAIVIKERRQLVEGDTWRNVLEEVDSAAFRLHPYRFPTSGWPETLEHITLDDVQRHFAAYYAPADAVLVAVGDFHSQELLTFIEAQFGKIPARSLPAPSTV